MTHRERVRRAVEFDGPDRAPRHHYIFPGAFRRHGQKLIDLVTEIPDDFDNIMGSDRVAEKIAGRICLRSDLDRQHIIPRGTPDEIVAHVKEILGLFGNFDGGIVLHGEVGPDVPFENIQALYGAMRDYGNYPLSWLG